jgi:hypothetical protein
MFYAEDMGGTPMPRSSDTASKRYTKMKAALKCPSRSWASGIDVKDSIEFRQRRPIAIGRLERAAGVLF